MQPRYSPLCQLFVVLFPLLPCTAAAAEAPVVTFEDSTVVVAAGQPAGRFALLGVGRLAGGYLPAQVRLGDLVVADALGDARYESAYGVPQPSVWAAVDLATGEVTLAAPGQDGVRLREVPPRALRQELDGLDDRRRFLEVLVVRPDSAPGAGDGGAWLRAFGDGGDGDGDGATNGNLRVVPSLLEPLGDAPAAPARFAPGDVVVAIDPDTLEAWTASVPGR